MDNKQILLVEDDQNFGDVLSSYLELYQYDVTLANDGVKGWNAFKDGKFDICILDVMMPEKDGFTLAKEILHADPSMPLIFLTAKSLKADVLEGFRIGADDYITKPFNSEELLLRINAILKRKRSNVPEKPVSQEVSRYYIIGDYHYDADLRILVYTKAANPDQKVKLSPRESALLCLFADNLNNVVARAEALTKIWGDDTYFTARSMDVFGTKLRKLLKEDPNIEIVNIHGNGFQLRVL
jgi:DNA-binding response OmpR family regulator